MLANSIRFAYPELPLVLLAMMRSKSSNVQALAPLKQKSFGCANRLCITAVSQRMAVVIAVLASSSGGVFWVFSIGH